MTEEPKEKQLEDYQFINEKIVPKRKNKWLRRLGTTLFVVFLAVVFGVVSQAVFLLSGNYLREWFGIGGERQEVDLPKPTVSLPRATMTPTPKPKPERTPTPVLTEQPTEPASPTVEPSITSGAEVTPEPTTGTAQGEKTPEATPTPEKAEDIGQNYLLMYDAIRKVAQEVSDSFVTVEAIEQGVDWFQEVYEKRTRTTGIVLGNDGVDLLILVGTEQFSGATFIEVSFGDEVVTGSIYSMDKDYGLAVIAVPLAEIPDELLEHIRLGILAEEEDIAVGTPVIALGAPNGYEGSMEFGMITSLGSTVAVTDGEVAYFTTNITEYHGGYGFVVNLEGEVLGLITHTHKENPEDGIFSAISLDSIRGVLVKLLNNAERSYFGIKGQDLPNHLAKEYELEAGVYVSEVENASPALAAGIKAGDILLAVGNTSVDGIRAFSDVILECSTREIVQVKLLRKAEDGLREMTVEVPLSGKN
ncbi:MAG: PDZ domain-containing protein [Lachnospiraceae bacterium]|nr:PDZ domain-containing protein [Lachnospiraceae bacterium]